MASLGAVGLAFLVFAAPEASSVNVQSADGLERTGSYQVVVTTRGKTYRSVWHLKVAANQITGTSDWECCPGKRTDKLSGTINHGDEIKITRFCVGQGQPPPCEQVYVGTLGATRISGSWSGTGSAGGSAAWTLYLDRMDVTFTLLGRGGSGSLVDEAQFLGGGRLVDLSYDNYAEKVTGVLSLRLQYTGGPEVRVSLRATRLTDGLLKRRDAGDFIVIYSLQVFKSTAPKGPYGCPQVGQSASLSMFEGSTDKVNLLFHCSPQRAIHWRDAGEAKVTIEAIKGSG